MINAEQARELTFKAEVFQKLEAKAEVKIAEAIEAGINECTVDGLRELAPRPLGFKGWGELVTKFFEAHGFSAYFNTSANDIIQLQW